MPVYNGEPYLKEAIDSILTQSFKDFELVISDNASTDRTREICLDYVAKDNRIRYYRNKQNVGAATNHNRVFELSRGDYFKWAAHDDVLAPEFLSKCFNLLERDKSIILCHSLTGRISETGELTGKYNTGIRFGSSRPNERFGDSIAFSNDSWVLLFRLIRPASVRMTRLFGSYIGSDRNLLAEISLAGKVYEIPEMLFYRREHKQAYTNKLHKSAQQQSAWWSKTQARTLYFPYWRRCLEYFKSVRRMPMKWTEKQLCNAQIIAWLLREGWVLMSLDIATNITKHFFDKHLHVRICLARIAQFFLQRGHIH